MPQTALADRTIYIGEKERAHCFLGKEKSI